MYIYNAYFSRNSHNSGFPVQAPARIVHGINAKALENLSRKAPTTIFTFAGHSIAPLSSCPASSRANRFRASLQIGVYTLVRAEHCFSSSAWSPITRLFCVYLAVVASVGVSRLHKCFESFVFIRLLVFGLYRVVLVFMSIYRTISFKRIWITIEFNQFRSYFINNERFFKQRLTSEQNFFSTILHRIFLY